MVRILDGKIVRDGIRSRLAKQVAGFGVKPKLVIIQLGKLEESNVFIRQKKLFGASIGAVVEHMELDSAIQQADLTKQINKLNKDKSVHGIIVQMPLPAHISTFDVIESVDPMKDVDGLQSKNVKMLWEHKVGGHIPATARGIVTLLDFYKIPIEGKRALVIGRSSLVGKSVALALLNRNATVTIAHKQTKHLSDEAKKADIIVVATGHKHLITKNFVSPGQVIIDVGIHSEDSKKSDGKKILTGDVAFDEVKGTIAAISPVPGGVGPLTVASLFQNLIDAYRKF